jgi:hypothetical protein
MNENQVSNKRRARRTDKEVQRLVEAFRWGRKILGMCCHFNAFLIDQGVTKCDDLCESLIDSFLDVYCKDLRTLARSR